MPREMFTQYMRELRAVLKRENKWLDSLPEAHATAYRDKQFFNIDKYKPRYRRITFAPGRETEMLLHIERATAFSRNHGDPNYESSESERLKSGRDSVSYVEKAEPEKYASEMSGWLQYHLYPHKVEEVCEIVELAAPEYEHVYEYDDSTNAYILEQPLDEYYDGDDEQPEE